MLMKNSVLRVLFISIFTFSALFSTPIGSASEKKERSYESSCKEKSGGDNHQSSISSLSESEQDQCCENVEAGSKSKSKQRSSRDEDKSKDNKCKYDKDDKDEDVKDEIEEVYVKTPAAVSNLLVATCSANVTLSWNTPTKPRSIPVTNYSIRYSLNAGLTWTTHPVTTTQTTITLDTLTPGVTYIFQVAAQNINGLGIWSASSSTCAIPNSGITSYSFVILGLDSIPDAFLDYSTAVNNHEQVSVGVNPRLTGSLVKGQFVHDLYLSLPTGVSYTFNINGLPAASTDFAYFPNSSNMGLGNPPVLNGNSFFYDGAQTFAFKINSGNSISIQIIP